MKGIYYLDEPGNEFSITEILEEVRRPGFLPGEPEPAEKPEPEIPEAPVPEDTPEIAVPAPSAAELANALKTRPRRPEPQVEVYKLPENPTKVDLARSILSNVQKEFGTISTVKPLEQQVTLQAPAEKKYRSGDIIHNRLLETPAPAGKKGDYIGKVTAEQQRAERQREYSRLAREKALELRNQTAEDDAKYLFEAFYSTKQNDESEFDTTKRLGPVIEEVIEQGKRLQEQSFDTPEPASAPEADDTTELTPDDVYYRYAAKADNLRVRNYFAILISLFMAYISLASSFGWSAPGFMTGSAIALTGTLAVGQLIITLLGMDIIITGLYHLVRLKPGAESMVAVAGLAAFADAAQSLISGSAPLGAPYSLTAAFTLVFAMVGARQGKSAYNRTLKTIAPMGGKATAIYAEWEKVDNGLVLCKSAGSTEGFLYKATRSDYTEQLFGKVAPLLIAASPVLAAVAAITGGHQGVFLRVWAAIACGAAAFNPLLAFNLPFNRASKRLAASNTVLAAWEGATDISSTVGLIIKDTDLFKPEMMKLSSFKVAHKYPAEQVVLYTASIIIHSQSGLTEVFRGLLSEYGLNPAPISYFEPHDGGGYIAAIENDRVYFGSEAFMRLMNVPLDDVPTKIGGAVFLAINGAAAGVFIVQYTPTEKVQRALLRMSKYRITPLLATRDVNITPTMLTEKFKLDMESIEFPPYNERCRLSDEIKRTRSKPSALLTKDTLSEFADIAEAGKWLYGSVRFGTYTSVLSSIIGALAMFILCQSGAFAAASPDKALLFHLAMAVVVVIRALF